MGSVEERVTGAAAASASERLVAMAEILAAEPDTARVLIDEAGRLPAEAEGHDRAHSRSLAELIARLLHAGGAAENGGDVQDQLMAGAVLEALRSAFRSGRAAMLPSQIPALVALWQPREAAHAKAADRPRRRAARRHATRSAPPAFASAG